MLDDLLIINESGSLLFNWHPEGAKESGDDDLLSGFLTAINSFATYERGEDIKSLKLRETNILFEKHDDLIQKLTFVITTKKFELLELLHLFIHEIMNQFVTQFKEDLNKEFDGNITPYKKFEDNVNHILHDLGLDEFNSSIQEIDQGNILKSIVYLDSNHGNIFYVHAKHYIDKEKLSFLIPLVLNSARLLYQNYLKESLKWVLLNSVKSETILVEPRDKIIVVKQFIIHQNLESDFLSLDFFKAEGKYMKKPSKLIQMFNKIKWNQSKQIYLIDLAGNILFSKILDNNLNSSDYIPETISFLTTAKKATIEIHNRILFNAVIAGEDILTICINLNNFALILIERRSDFKDFDSIQDHCVKIYTQLI